MTDSAQLHAVVVHLETEGRGIWDLQAIETVVFEIVELVAAQTDQVMVKLETWVEAGDPTGMTGLGDHSHTREVLESAVDGGARDAGEAVLDGVEDLIGRRVIIELEDRFEDDPALHGATLTALAAELFEKLDAFFPCRLVQAAAPKISVILSDELDENMWHQTENVNKMKNDLNTRSVSKPNSDRFQFGRR